MVSSINIFLANRFTKQRLFLYMLVVLFNLSNAFAQNHQLESQDLPTSVYQSIAQNPQLVVEQKMGSEFVRVAVSDLGEVSKSDAAHFIEQTAQKFDTVISTDDDQILKSSLHSGAQSLKQMRLLPFGALSSARSKFNQFIQYQKDKVKTNIKYDKIGLTVALVSVGIDSFYWIHSSALDVHQKSSLVTFNLLLCATFGVNPDLWPTTIRPLKGKIFDVLNKFKLDWKYADKTATVISQYVSNFALSSMVQTTRVSLMSMDHLFDSMSTSHFWFSAVGVSALATLTQFAWSELSASVDIKKFPKSVIMLRRLTNFRVILLAQFASMSQVLQPGVYGYSPMATMIVSGGLGLVALLSTHSIIEFLENNKFVEVLYQQNQRVETFLQNLSFSKKTAPAVLSCDMLFN